MLYDNETLFAEITQLTGGSPVHIGGKLQVPLNCPYCGAVSTERNCKSSFGQILDEAYDGWGFHCFFCGASEHLYGLMLALGQRPNPDYDAYSFTENTRTQLTTSQKQYTWQERADELADTYARDPKRFTAWERYKGLTRDAVEEWNLGLGRLPETRHTDERLITPVYDGPDGHVMWLRGRSVENCDAPKWLGAGGVRVAEMPLSMGWLIQRSKPLLVVENYVDALAINHYLGDRYSAVPTFSVSYWSEGWLKEIVDRKPSQVIVCYDPDLAGNGPVNKEHARSLFTERICKLSGLDAAAVAIKGLKRTPPRWSVRYETPEGESVLNLRQPAGLTRVEQILQAGLPAKVLRWPGPDKDMGDFLADMLRSRG